MAIKIDKRTTAAFDVDCQKGFTPLCPDELPVPEGEKIGEELNRQAHLASLRVASKDCHNPNAVWVATPDKPQYSQVGLPNSDIRWNRHCEVGTRGHELLDGLPAPEEYDFMVYKGVENHMHPYGACFHDLKDRQSTGVIEFLKIKGIKAILAGGLATDYCVKNTVLQLLKAGFSVVVNLAACRGISPDTTQKAIEEMRSGGARIVQSSSELSQA